MAVGMRTQESRQLGHRAPSEVGGHPFAGPVDRPTGAYHLQEERPHSAGEGHHEVPEHLPNAPRVAQASSVQLIGRKTVEEVRQQKSVGRSPSEDVHRVILERVRATTATP